MITQRAKITSLTLRAFNNVMTLSNQTTIFFKGKRKLRRSVWAEAIKMLRRTKMLGKNNTITQQELLTSLGFTKKEMRSRDRGRILKRLIIEGVLLDDGTPNLENKKVIEIVSHT